MAELKPLEVIMRIDFAASKGPEVVAHAEAVQELVRCRDCRHNYNTCVNSGINEPKCYFTDYKLTESDFCSRGVRREL